MSSSGSKDKFEGQADKKNIFNMDGEIKAYSRAHEWHLR